MNQSTGKVLMVRPASFGFNPETIDNNFQKTGEVVKDEILSEFDGMVNLLQTAGIDVIVVPDNTELAKPDAVFPNNWFSTSCNKIMLYPMFATNRRKERRSDIIEMLSDGKEIFDLTEYEKDAKYLEGTGSLVLDHLHKKAYAAISNRTHPDLVNEWCAVTGYSPVLFSASDAEGKTVYHTNVMMCVGTGYAVVCTGSVTDIDERKNLVEELANSGLEIIDISLQQMNAFAGNMIELEGTERCLLMSKCAYDALNPAQLEVIKKYAAPLPVAIPTIETIGGGSVRCMIAELF